MILEGGKVSKIKLGSCRTNLCPWGRRGPRALCQCRGGEGGGGLVRPLARAPTTKVRISDKVILVPWWRAARSRLMLFGHGKDLRWVRSIPWAV